jgi:serine/threonine protein kinase
MTKVVDNFALIEEIGSGQYGKVYRAQHIKSGENFAVKCIGLEKYRKVPKLDEFTNNEIKVLTKLVHPNIVRFHDRLKTANNIYMVYEYCNGGTLETLIYNSNLTVQKCMEFFDQLIQGFKVIAAENILHRDIKPSNILVHNNEVIKIADFGFCKSLFGELDMTKTMVGSPIYMAPELLRGTEYSQKADVWSLGVMLYEMIHKFCPFEEKNIPNLINLIERSDLKFPKPLPDNVKNLLRGMLTKDHIRRWSWAELFKYYDEHFGRKDTLTQNRPPTLIYSSPTPPLRETGNQSPTNISRPLTTLNYNPTSTQNVPQYSYPISAGSPVHQPSGLGGTSSVQQQPSYIPSQTTTLPSGGLTMVNNQYPTVVPVTAQPISFQTYSQNAMIGQHNKYTPVTTTNAAISPSAFVYKSPSEPLTAAPIALTQTTGSTRRRQESLPVYLLQMKESPYRLLVSEFEVLMQQREFTGTEGEELMIERCKMNCLLHCLTKINKFGFLDQSQVKEMFLAILKKIRQCSLNVKVKLNSLTNDMLQEFFDDGENFKISVQTEIDKFGAFYLRFIDECDKSIKDIEKNGSESRDPKHAIIKAQVEKAFEYDEGYFKRVLLEQVRHLFGVLRQEHAESSYAQSRHYHLINFMLDCLLIDVQIRLFFDPWAKPAQQKYFDLIDRLPQNELYNLIKHKFDYANTL